jgi:hypothetical protein
MGNRSNLLIKQDGQFVSLFEGNNTIALFWLMLMDESELAAFGDKIAKIFSEEELPDDFDSTIVLDKDSALVKALSHKEKIHSKNVLLFGEWLGYLDSQSTDDGKIYLHIAELAGFYENADKYLDFLRGLAASAEPVEPYSQWMTGWDSIGTFRKASAIYRNLEMPDDTIPHEHRTKLSDFKFLIVLVIIAILVGIAGVALKIIH